MRARVRERPCGFRCLLQQFHSHPGCNLVERDHAFATRGSRQFHDQVIRDVTGGVQLLNSLNHRSTLLKHELAGVEQILDRLREFGAGGVATAVRRMRQANQTLRVEVEAQSLCEVDAALEAGADVVLLDNLSTADMIEAVAKCRGKARTEISGGVTLSRMPELAATGADYVSIGALTHSAPAADLSFEIVMGK